MDNKIEERSNGHKKEIEKSIFKIVGGFSTKKIEFTAGCFPRLPAIIYIPD